MITALRKPDVIEFSDGECVAAAALDIPLDDERLPHALALAFVNRYVPRDFDVPGENTSQADLQRLQSHVRAWSARREALAARFEDEIRDAIKGLEC